MPQLSTKNYLLKTDQGATTILLAFLVLSVLLMTALTASTIMMYQVQMSRETANSIQAFYTADAMAEECLYQVRTMADDSGDNCTRNNKPIQLLLNLGGYNANGTAWRENNNALKAEGVFQATQRQMELSW
ncbi:MAG: hypothetical protein A3B04_00590 [Candidatus Portnoybacteria bacterium RIFCSPLOWO2_02_FULL_39_11]|uniref:Type 4 fimbrial biogenesis protein PilX N-terminal domain-containing protein n=1 Tax=Candidatus Portnoybacteria bacterium RIFCSPLOWO2_02_FULL_39_11 TaxID=1802001 RepID=A0A1G2FRG4_9BACT|nr:MAG: hypothetical protein A3B04_00590 [Candidatus Portnoybacteria bacterium RIFCSPLOWO2_02_FULL_39_11]